MRTVVSFSLYGTDLLYQAGAVRNAVMYAEYRPTWELWFYTGRSILQETRDAITASNPLARFIDVAEKENAASTWWRMRALTSLPDVFMSRDTDSVPSARQRAAEDEWLASDFNAHIMRDHNYHGAVILAGLWGVKGFSVGAIANRLKPKVMDFWTVDQQELQLIHPMIRRLSMVHLGCDRIYERINQRRPFTVPREPGEFVGQGLLADGTPRFPEHCELIQSDEYLLSHPEVFEAQYRFREARV